MDTLEVEEEYDNSSPPDSVPANVLCDACARIVRESKSIKHLGDGDHIPRGNQAKPEKEIFFYRRSIHEAIESREAGCHLCNLLFHDADVEMYPWYDDGVVWACLEYHHAAWRKGEEGAEVRLTVNFEEKKRDEWKIIWEDGNEGVGEEENYVLFDQLLRSIPVTELSANSFGRVSIWKQKDTDILFPQLVGAQEEESLGCSTGSPKALELAKLWLDDCLRDHPDCRPSAFSHGHQRPPTRLVDIGDVSGHLSPRLILTPGSATLADMPYLTLSHSWAITAVRNIKLSVSNLTTLQEAIPWDGLSQTFKDALEITQSLGYRYIWIDSLCIIQDSREDWEKEALAMSTVYGNSVCNLAALGIDQTDQCFSERNPLKIAPCRISKPEAQSTVYATTRDTGLRRFPEPGRIPLLDRGWVFQERMLPPRLLHFGGEQIYWECRHHALSEALPIKSFVLDESLYTPLAKHQFLINMLKGSGQMSQDGANSPSSDPASEPEAPLPVFEDNWWDSEDEYLWTFGSFTPRGKFQALCGTTTKPTTKKTASGFAPTGQLTPMNPTLRKLLQHWQDILTSYTIASLTCSSDRLIALVGVVQTIKNHIGLTYVPGSGTWKEFWPFDLLWNSRQVLALRFPCGAGAPSWSWAAAEGAKEFQIGGTIDWRDLTEDNLKYVAHLVEYREEEEESHQGDTAKGTSSELNKKNTKAVILVKGLIKDAVVYGPYPGWGEYRMKLEGKSEGVVVRWDEHPVEENLDDSGQEDEDFYGPKECGSLELLLLIRWSQKVGKHDAGMGLILKRVVESEPEGEQASPLLYRRVGMFYPHAYPSHEAEENFFDGSEGEEVVRIC